MKTHSSSLKSDRGDRVGMLVRKYLKILFETLLTDDNQKGFVLAFELCSIKMKVSKTSTHNSCLRHI